MISALRVQAIPGEEGRNIEPTTWTQDTEPSSDDACKRRSRSRLSLRDLSEIRDRCAPIITRQVASDLGTLGTSLGRAGRIRQLLGALGAVLERVVRMWRDPPKGRSSPGSTGSNHAHDEARAKSRRHQGLQPGPLVADAAPSEAVRRKLVAITLPQQARSWSVDADWIEDAAAAR